VGADSLTGIGIPVPGPLAVAKVYAEDSWPKLPRWTLRHLGLKIPLSSPRQRASPCPRTWNQSGQSA